MKPSASLPNYSLPSFIGLQEQKTVDQLRQVLQDNRLMLSEALTNPHLSCDALLKALDEMDDKISAIWYPLQHLMQVAATAELQEIYQACVSELGTYALALGQNQALFERMKILSQGALSATQRQALQKNLLTFRLSGIHLPPEKQIAYAELQETHSVLMQQFDHNVMQATYSWLKVIEEKNELDGLPQDIIDYTARVAKFKNVKGFALTLDEHCYSAVMRYAHSRALREEIYKAYLSRASGVQDKRFDNTLVIAKIMAARQGIARLLKYDNYAEFALSSRMLETPRHVCAFLYELMMNHTEAQAEQELAELAQLAQARDGLQKLEGWDIDYYSEILRSQKLGISELELRQYFPLDHVLTGLFSFIQDLFQITIEELTTFEGWHPTVRCFALYDQSCHALGVIYLDAFMRPGKRDFMWTEQISTYRLQANDERQKPIAIVTCNFKAPADAAPCLLNLEGLRILFHEFGHAVYHVLSKVEYGSLSGFNGLPLDAIEIPSFFFETWVYHKDMLRRISKHIKTGKSLPDNIIDNLHRVKNFPNALQLMQRIKKALFDIRLHADMGYKTAQQIWQELGKETPVLPHHSFDHFPNSFALIFSNGYAAGYYSYLWSEMIASDLFEHFAEDGFLNKSLNGQFLQQFWEVGGSSDLLSAFIHFKGREPKNEALLNQRRIA